MKRFLLILITSIISQLGFAQSKPARKQSAPVKPPVVQNPQPAPAPQAPAPVIGDPTKDNVAIYPFTSASGFDYTYAESVGNAVESGFVRSARFNVVERNRFGSISQEERFKEVNTDNIVKIAAKLGAKYIITGHITGASTAEYYDSDHRLSGYQTTINVAFKIIEVETSLIKASESVNIIGQGATNPLSKGNAYASINGITRTLIANNFPQQFKFMSVLTTETKKDITMLTVFKFWGGSDNGIKVGDVVQLYSLSYVFNPTTNKKITEKNIIGFATITAINSGSTSTCEVYKPKKYGAQLLDAFTKTPDLVSIEYSGHDRPRGIFGL